MEVPEDVRLKRQRGMVVLAPQAQAIADEALPRMDRLRACSINVMAAMGRVLEAQGETDEPTLFDGWARLLYSDVASKREEAIQAFDAGMDIAGHQEDEERRKREEEDDRDDAGVDGDSAEPPMLMDTLAQKTHPMPVDLEFANTRGEGPAPGKLVQGGTGGSHEGLILKAALKYHGYDFKDTDKFGVVLFGKDGGTDAVKFNGKVFDASLPKDAGVDDFKGTNIVPVNLGDPTPERPWREEELTKFYDAVDLASGWLKAGKMVVVACVAGANRSVGVCRALQPNDSKWPLPTCPSMDAAAAGWRAGRDLKIAPLAPPPKTATTRAGASRA